MKPIVKIRHVNFYPGFDEGQCRSHVLMDLCDEYDFIFSDTSDVLLVGCYGQQPVRPEGAVKVGYYTENLPPDVVNFDYFFGCEYSSLIGHPRYCKRVFGPLRNLPTAGCSDPLAAMKKKTEFANFIYTTRIAYRERFFSELNWYKPVRAPGKAMNNCQDLASRGSVNWQAEKIDYLAKFKFTIAFENSRRRGYTTEKLYDAFVADTVPIYWGDPELDTIVNKDAVIFVEGDWERDVLPWLRLPEARDPFRPAFRRPNLLNKLAGRFNDGANSLRSAIPYSKGFDAAIAEVIALDRDDEAYARKLAQPRVKLDAVLQIRRDYFAFWRKIIDHALVKNRTRVP